VEHLVTPPLGPATARRVLAAVSEQSKDGSASTIGFAGLCQSLASRCQVSFEPNRMKVSYKSFYEGHSGVIDRTTLSAFAHISDVNRVVVGPAGRPGCNSKKRSENPSQPLDIAGVIFHVVAMLLCVSDAVADDAISFLALLPLTASEGPVVTSTRRSLVRICTRALSVLVRRKSPEDPME